jgi:hypothetical protein
MKYNPMNEISDLVISLTPLKLYSPNTSKSKSMLNWLMELISEHSLKILPSMFFEKELHRNLNTSFSKLFAGIHGILEKMKNDDNWICLFLRINLLIFNKSFKINQMYFS